MLVTDDRVPAPAFRRPSGWDAAVIAVSIASAATLLVSTPQGVGVYPDSVQYIAAARRVLEGHGLQGLSAAGDWIPLTRFPPLYPLLLALTSWVTGTDPLIAARWVHVCLWGVNVFLGARLTRAVVSGADWAPFVGALALSCCPILLRLHSLAFSEPLFMTMVLAALRLLTRDATRPGLSRHGLVVALCAAALLTRFVGLAIVATAVVVVAVRAPGDVSTSARVRRASCVALTSGMPLALWMLWRLDAQSATAGRSLRFHPPDSGYLQQCVASVWGWVVPWELPAGMLHGLTLRLPLLGIVLVLLVVFVRGRRGARPTGTGVLHRPETAVVGFLLCYPALVACARTFADAAIDFDDRMLMPVLFLTIVLAVRGCVAPETAGPGTPTRLARRVPLLLLFAWIVVSTVRSGLWVKGARQEGQGLAGRTWRESSLLARLRTADPSVRYVSNVPDALYLWLGKPAVLLPVIQDPVSGERNPDVEAELSALQRKAQESQVCIVLFDEAAWRWYLPSPEELLSHWRGTGIAEERCADGTLLGACAKP